MKNKRVSYAKILVLLTAFTCSVISLSAQTPTPTPAEDKKTKDFGSSLKKDDKKDPAEDDEVVRVETNLVVNDILVLDKKGRSVLNLNKSDFIITEDGAAQDIEMFSLGENVAIPRTIVLIFDYSSSQRPYINTSVDAAKVLVDNLNPKDRMAIITDDVSLLVNFTSDKKLLKNKLESLKIWTTMASPSRNLQYSALYAALNEMFTKKDVFPIIIFQTDGDELPYFKDRIFSFEDILKATEKARATIYTIVPSPSLIGLSEKDQIKKVKTEIKDKQGFTESKNLLKRETQEIFQQQQSLIKLAKFTGGWNEFLETPERAGQVYPKILEELNRRYMIGYYPTNDVRDGTKRNVKIEVRGHPEYTVEGRKAYITPDQKVKNQ